MKNKLETHPFDNELDRIASSIAQESVPSDVVEKMKAKLKQPSNHDVSISSTQSSWLVRSSVLKWTSVAALLASLLAVAMVFSSDQTSVFAQMQLALDQASTIQLNKRSYAEGEAEPYHRVKFYINDSNHYRTEETGLRKRISVVDAEALQMMNVWPEPKKVGFHQIYDRDGLEKATKAFLDIIRFVDAESAVKVGSVMDGDREIIEYEFETILPTDESEIKVNVFVDATTNLPTKIVEIHNDPPSRFIYENIVFGEPLDPALFELTPPEGYEVHREKRIDDSALLLTSGVGLGDVKFGDSDVLVRKAFGSPSFMASPEYWISGELEQDKDKSAWFYSRGFRFCISKNHGVYEITCGQMPDAQPFQGLMPGDIRIGASREEVEKVYGSLYELSDDDSMDYQPTKETTTSFRFADGKLSLIVLSRDLPESVDGEMP